MAFRSNLTQDDYNKKPGDLIKASDWNALTYEIVSLGKAKLDRESDTLHGELRVNGTLTVEGTASASKVVVPPGSLSAGFWLGATGESGIYRSAQLSPAGRMAATGDLAGGEALRIRTTAEDTGGLLIENQNGDINFSVRGSDGATFVRGALTVGGGEVLLPGNGGGAGNNGQAARALSDGGPEEGLILNRANDFGKVTVQSALNVNGPVRASSYVYNNPMVHRMFPADPIIYQDIFEALRQGAIAKLGNPAVPSDWNTRHGPQNLWNKRTIVQFGTNNDADGNGAVVTLPDGYDTVWVRLLNDRWNVIKAYILEGDALNQDLGLWAGGARAHSICPDGSISDSDGTDATHTANRHNHHQWFAVPVGRAGRIALISKQGTENGLWISGVAFSRNPWAHATQSAAGYHWGLNGTESGVRLAFIHHGDIYGSFLNPANLALQVPVLPSGRDKLLYVINPHYLLAESARYDCDVQHTMVSVNGQPVGRFMATYDNPFARHWNTMPACAYSAVRVPAELIRPGDRYLKVQIDTSKQVDIFAFRELGTHDLDIPIAF